MTLKAIVHEAEEGGFWAEVPALPGCVTQGETEEEIRSNLLEAVELWFEAGEATAHPQQKRLRATQRTGFPRPLLYRAQRTHVQPRIQSCRVRDS